LLAYAKYLVFSQSFDRFTYFYLYIEARLPFKGFFDVFLFSRETPRSGFSPVWDDKAYYITRVS